MARLPDPLDTLTPEAKRAGVLFAFDTPLPQGESAPF